MYIYFKSLNKVLTCEEYPQVLSLEEMKLNNQQNMCNKWEKIDTEDGKFTLSFKYKKHQCSCDNSQYIYLEDYYNFECYNCGIGKTPNFKEGDNLYLQNSSNIDILCVNPINKYCQICEVDGYPNIYKWINDDYDNLIFTLHVKDNLLSDADISEEINTIQESCHIVFTEEI